METSKCSLVRFFTRGIPVTVSKFWGIVIPFDGGRHVRIRHGSRRIFHSSLHVAEGSSRPTT